MRPFTIISLVAMPLFLLLSMMVSLAAEHQLSLSNCVAHDWPRTLLHYDLTFAKGEMKPREFQVLDAAGATVPAQLDVTERYPDGSVKAGRVCFYAALPKGASATYHVTAVRKPALVLPRVTVKTHGGVMEVSSDTLGVRLPAPRLVSFTTPVPPAQVPAPILGYRLAGGQWAGKGWLESERKVASWSQQVVADGPLYKEYAYEVRFAPVGYYRVRVRVEAEGVLVPVAEEYDMGAATAGKDFFVFSLNAGWKPDTVVFAADRPSGPQWPGLKQVRDRRVENDTAVWTQPLDFTQTREHTSLYPTGDWGTKTQWYGLYDGKGDAASPFAGILTEHTGAWRLPDQSLSPIVWTADGQVLVKFRTSLNLNGAPQNPFGTNEIDPGLPQTLAQAHVGAGARTAPGAERGERCAGGENPGRLSRQSGVHQPGRL